MRWEENLTLPRCVAALLDSLRFDGDARELPMFSEEEWKAALYYFDRHQLSLLLGARAESRLARNRERLARIKQAFWEIKDALEETGIEFVTLKGFTHWARYWPDPESRVQYDLDLFCPGAAIEAREALRGIGYETQATGNSRADHLPSLARKSEWQWRGDFFDPNIPISVELHFRLWDEGSELFPAPGVEEFWPRRVTRALDGRSYLALDPVDELGYGALHLLRHLLRGETRAASVYEIGYALHHSVADDGFWTRWGELHSSDLRRLQAICFRLAADWFGCRMNPAAQAEVELLPADIRRWFAQYAASPAESLFRPNKDELWLHLSLLDSLGKKLRITGRRLIPMKLPRPPAQSGSQYARYLAGRLSFHARALAPTLSRILRTRA